MHYDSDSSRERTEGFACLKIDEIKNTMVRLEARVRTRFPDRGIHRIAQRMVELATSVGCDKKSLTKPYWPARLAAIVLALALAGLITMLAATLAGESLRGVRLIELLQGVEAAINDAVFLSIGLYFAATLERRWKRRFILRSLHRIRSIIHVIDMHQLTKDPEMFISPDQMAKGKFPAAIMTRFEMVRYLDYCSEMYSLASKLAAQYLSYSDDDVVLDAVNDIESIATGLSQKVWQKITILDEPPRAIP